MSRVVLGTRPLLQVSFRGKYESVNHWFVYELGCRRTQELKRIVNRGRKRHFERCAGSLISIVGLLPIESIFESKFEIYSSIFLAVPGTWWKNKFNVYEHEISITVVVDRNVSLLFVIFTFVLIVSSKEVMISWNSSGI